jgi:hypothetical protein
MEKERARGQTERMEESGQMQEKRVGGKDTDNTSMLTRYSQAIA